MCTGNTINITDPLSLHKPKDQGGILGAPDPLDLGGWKAKAAAQTAKDAKSQAEADRKAVTASTPPASQVAQQPDQAALRAAAISRVGGGSSTTTTGPGGVSPSLLSIGKNQLLGS